MINERFSLQESGIVNRLMADYLEGSESIEPFCRDFANEDSLRNHRDQRRFSDKDRTILVKALDRQYGPLRESGLELDSTYSNIQNLLNSNTFTVTTGHQLNLATGPVFFFIKVLHVIKMANQLNAKWRDSHVVPVYWMATEDHDHEEIDHFYWGQKRITWKTRFNGAVGRFPTDEILKLLPEMREAMGPGKKAEEIIDLFEEAYSMPTLADATRYLVHKVLGHTGLVIIDGDDPVLKRSMVQVFQEDVRSHSAYEAVTRTSSQLEELGYPTQVTPRKINLFYLDDKGRHRLVREGERFHHGTGKTWSELEILTEIESHPENFSPNVVLRPLYQEMILPNLCYVGGGGEISYWMQLGDMFDQMNVQFPVLWLRNSIIQSSSNITRKKNKIDLPWVDFLGKMGDAQSLWVEKHSPLPLELNEQRSGLERMFEGLDKLADQTDASMKGAVAAQRAKQLKGLENLEKKLRRAEKRKNETAMHQIQEVCDHIKPGGVLQERRWNYFYLDHSSESVLHKTIYSAMDPFKSELIILD